LEAAGSFNAFLKSAKRNKPMAGKYDKNGTAAVEHGLSREGKYLTFVLATEEYGLEILRVREILGMMAITPVPQTPEFVKGVINLRGKVTPVIDLRLKFGMPSVDYTQETCIIVVEVEDMRMGVVVDTVNEVVDITENQIEDAPRFGTNVDTSFILGLGKIGDKVKILLNIAKVLSTAELVLITDIIEE
jgi:purine-binding chemotaxis protein CheW